MNIVIDRLKRENIYAISVLYDSSLEKFYEKFGFIKLCAGQIINE